MSTFWLGVAAGTVIGVLICIAAVSAVLIWSWLAGRNEGEWVPPADW